MCFEKMLWGTSEMGECYSFQNFAIVFSTTQENLLAGIFGALGMKGSHSLRKKMCFEKML